MTNPLKKLREERGWTQNELAEKSSVSIRTIQRLEQAQKPPKGYTLEHLSIALNVDPISFRNSNWSLDEAPVLDKSGLKMINLSILSMFICPFGNLIFPYLLWQRRKSQKLADTFGKRIVNFQILWTVAMCFLLVISPFVQSYIGFNGQLILLVLLLLYISNFCVVVFTANAIEKENFDFLKLPIQVI